MTRIHLSRRRLAWLLGGAVAFMLLVALAWLAVTALLARSEVSKAKDALSQLRDSIVAGDSAKANAEAAAVADHASRAHTLTTGPAWWAASQLPWMGEPLETVRGASAQADLLGRDVLPALVKVADELSPSTLRVGDTVHIGRLAAAAADAQRVAATVILLGIVSMLTDISSESVNAVLPIYLTSILGMSTLAYGFIDGIPRRERARTHRRRLDRRSR